MAGEALARTQLRRSNAMEDDAYNRMIRSQEDVRGAVMPYLSGNVGFDPAALKQMIAQFLNQNSANFNQAGQNLRSALAARGMGGNGPVGGDYVRGVASLEGAKASNLSSGVANINLQDLAARLTNKFNAAGLISGQGAQMAAPIGTFGSSGNNALNAYITAANQPGFMSAFKQSLGAGLAKGITGGIGAMTGGAF